MEFYKRGKTIWCDFTVNGRRYRKSTKQTAKAAAETAAFKMQEQIQQGYGLKPKHIPTLAEYGKTFLEYIEKHNKLTDGSKEHYINTWKRLSTQEIVKLRLDRITTKNVETITVVGSNASHNAVLGTLSRIMNLAVEEGIIRRDRTPYEPKFPKFTYLEVPKREAMIEAEDDERISAFLKLKRRGCHNGSLKTAWAIHMDTGMRPIEVANLRVEHIDFQNMKITVGKSKTRNGRGRILPISQRMKDLLIKRVDGRVEGWLFPSPKLPGKPITRGALTNAFYVMRKRLNFPKDKKLYTTRHTFGTEIMNRTGDPYLVADAMGHKDLKTGRIYQHKKVEQIAKVIQERDVERTAFNDTFYGTSSVN